MTDPAPLLVLGPLAGAFLALAVLYADRRGPPPRIRLTAPTCAVPAPQPLTGWVTVDLGPASGVASHARPVAQRRPRGGTARAHHRTTWPDPPPARHLRQTTTLTSSVARAWDQQGYDW